MRRISTIIMAIALGIFCFSVSSLPAIGDKNSAPNTHITPYYIENSAKDTGSPNIVTAVLADYRGFDTLEETTVMFLAGLTTVLVLSAEKKEHNTKKHHKNSGQEMEKTTETMPEAAKVEKEAEKR